jgi:Domain of unknown function (DUF4304)
MDSKEFKKSFNDIPKTYGFEKAFGGWFKVSPECIAVLELQKSNFGDYYELNVKIFIQGMFGNAYIKNKDLVKRDIGDIFTRQPNSFKDALDFDTSMEDSKRQERLEKLFSEFIVPFTTGALSKTGIRELADKGEIFLLPAVKQELAE